MHTLTSFSELPRHLEATDEAEMLKKVVLHSVATALASRVLPVPGGPYSKMPYATVTVFTSMSDNNAPCYYTVADAT